MGCRSELLAFRAYVVLSSRGTCWPNEPRTFRAENERERSLCSFDASECARRTVFRAAVYGLQSEAFSLSALRPMVGNDRRPCRQAGVHALARLLGDNARR